MKIDNRKAGFRSKPTVQISHKYHPEKIQFKYKKNPKLDKVLGDNSWLKKNPNIGYYHDLMDDLFVD